MLFPDFMPIENDGMSVITGIVLFFLIIGGTYFTNSFSKCNARQDKTIENHTESINEIKVNIATMKGDVHETKTVMDRMESGIVDMLKANQSEISEMRKTYQAVLLTNLKTNKD